jgi:TPP-dependent pyruvate/acetoin dehydrogenase alpha subunit
MKNWQADELIAFEQNCKKLFEQGKINCPLHLSGGNEAELIDFFKSIKHYDYVFSTHRSHYHYLLKGGSAKDLLDELQGKKTAVCKGRARSMNICDPRINFYASAIVAGSCAIAVGVALALKKKKRKGVVWCFLGDGAEDSGHFVEAARFAYARGLPLTFIIEDNDLSVYATKEQRWHRHPAFNCPNVLRYDYIRTEPHVGIGKHVQF